jgi:hypothetical protein
MKNSHYFIRLLAEEDLAGNRSKNNKVGNWVFVDSLRTVGNRLRK